MPAAVAASAWLMPSSASAIAGDRRAARLLRSREASLRSSSAVRSSRILSARPVSPPSRRFGRWKHGSGHRGILQQSQSFRVPASHGKGSEGAAPEGPRGRPSTPARSEGALDPDRRIPSMALGRASAQRRQDDPQGGHPVDPQEFERWSRHAPPRGARYRRSLGDRPVRARTRPGEIYAAIPSCPPEAGEAMETIFADFERIVEPGMTHWQHPRFFAYFPANAAPVSVVAEQLVAAMAAQCMLWQTSPAATELETRMMEWLRDALGLPAAFSGVIQDSASSATLAAMLVMRERALGWDGNRRGLAGGPTVRIYCSDQVHSSIDRAAWISGVGQDNLVKIPADPATGALRPEALAAAIRADRDAGLRPAGVVACVGGTSVGASDDVRAVIAIAREHDLYVHVDAAWAGAAMICPEFRPLWDGAEGADSIVFNPHKWLGASFDCSAHLVRDPEALVRTLAIQPEYLKTHGRDGVTNYSEWSIPLGRAS